MTDDLISRSALEQEGFTHFICVMTGGKVVRSKRIAEAPTVDAVEVVRCKDCTFCKPSAAPGRFFCDWHRDYFETFPDDFCSHGERKADE